MSREWKKAPIVVALSGGGRTLKNLLKYQNEFAYQVCGIISSKETSPGAIFAKDQGFDLFHGDFREPVAGQTIFALATWLQQRQPEWIVLAGFLKKFPQISGFQGRVINIHPALLPDFSGHGMYGLHVHKAVKKAGLKQTGASVHVVNEVYDDGPVLAQITVPICKKDTAEQIAAKVFAGECKLYPQVIHRLVTGELPLAQGKIFQLTEGSP